MKIVVIGPGALGSYLAGLLAETGHAVQLVDKLPGRASQLAREGLFISEGSQTRHVKVKVSVQPEGIRGGELVIICVKAHDTASILPGLKAFTSPQTDVLTLQNGLGNIEQLSFSVSPEHLFAGVTAHGFTLLGVGRVRHAGKGTTTLAAMPGCPTGRVTFFANVLSQAGLESKVAADMNSMLWSKLIVNAAIGPAAALSGLPNGELARQQPWRDLMQHTAEESARIAVAHGVKLAYPDPVSTVLEVCRLTAENIASMLQDVRHQRKTEIDAINGAIVRMANKLGMSAPVNEDLCRRVKALAM